MIDILVPLEQEGTKAVPRPRGNPPAERKRG